MDIFYLHGFASGPGSGKAQFLRTQFKERGIELNIPDLAEGAFERLTITGQLNAIDKLALGKPARGKEIALIGSSLGGYLAALYAATHTSVSKLVLLAPGFYFPQRWPASLGEETLRQWKRTGKLPVYHYGEGRMMDLGYGLVEDARLYDGAPHFEQPALVIHGTRDDVVPVSVSEEFAATHPNVKLLRVDAGHELKEVLDLIWNESSKFLGVE